MTSPVLLAAISRHGRYKLGLRHAFDADHIAAIDNSTRKLMGEEQDPLSVGFFFAALTACLRQVWLDHRPV